MSLTPISIGTQKRLSWFATALLLLMVAFVRPNSRLHEIVVLASAAVLLCFIGIVVRQGNAQRMFRALGLARREHALFLAAADSSPQAFCLCKPVVDQFRRVIDFRLGYINHGAEELFGLSRAELTGRLLSSFLSKPMRLHVMAVWVRVAATGLEETLDMEIERANGGREAVRARVIVRQGRVALAVLPAGGQAVPAAQTSADVAAAMVASSPLSMIATDAEGTIVMMNAAAEALTQYASAELAGCSSLLQLHDAEAVSSCGKHPEGAAQTDFCCLLAGVAENGERDWTYVRKDGSPVLVSLTLTPLGGDGEGPEGYLATARDITRRKQLSDSVAHMAHHDQLTGLPNRALLQDRMKQGMERARRFRQRLAVFLVDIDNFKRVNDSLGHMGGDALLRFVAGQLQSAVRATDTVARVGGDEFVVLMPDFQDMADAERCASLMLQKISTPVRIGSREVRVTASIGLCLYPDGADDSSELLRGADVAMHGAKQADRGGFRVFSSEMEQEEVDRLELEEDLRHALDNRELSLAYQPQIRCATGEVTGMEMLLRWTSAKRGNVPPVEFIGIAEEAGLMVTIGEWALVQACVDCAAMQRELGRPLTVAVNLSARQLGQRNLTALVQRALDQSGLEARYLEIEITEHMLMTNTSEMLETLQQMRALGVRIAIDDFGTGFSSFAYILQYNIDRLKIDRSFIERCTREPGPAAIVQAIIAMAHGLNIDVVAEGVESLDQLNFLLQRRCDDAQGFLFARPVAIGAFAGKVAEIAVWVERQKKLAAQAVSAGGDGPRRSTRERTSFAEDKAAFEDPAWGAVESAWESR